MSDRTDVVTVFLENPSGNILLGKRSEDVKTYNKRWAGISGYLEHDDALDQAYEELREETGLLKSDVSCIRRGDPLAVDDDDNEQYWTVHPFRFRKQSSTPVSTDREHIEFKWVEQSDIGSLHTVPGLLDAWKRVNE